MTEELQNAVKSIAMQKGDPDVHLRTLQRALARTTADSVKLSIRNALMMSLRQLGRNAELVAACREQESLIRRLHGELSMPHTVVLSSLGFALCTVGDYEEAEATFTRSLAAQNKMEDGQAAAASTLHNMGLLFKNTGRLQEAAQAYSDSISKRRAPGGDVMKLVLSLRDVASVHASLGDAAAAAAAAAECEQILRRLQPQHPWIGEMAAIRTASDKGQ